MSRSLEGSKTERRAPGYLVQVLPEALLTVAFAVCFAIVVMQGFVVDPAIQFAVVPLALVCLVLQAPLYLGADPARSRGAQVAGGAVFALLAVGILVWGVASSGEAGALADDESAHVAPALVLVLANLLAYLLSRRMGGLFALALITLATFGFVEYAYQSALTVPSVAAYFCLAALLMVRNHALSVRAAGEAAHGSYGRAAGAALITAAACTAVAVAVWTLVIAPLAPGRVDVKLFTEYRSPETVLVTNPTQTIYVEDPDQTTVTVTDEQTFGDKTSQITGDDPALAQLGDFIANSREMAGEKSDYRFELDENGVYLYTLSTPTFWWLLWFLVPVALIVVAVVVRLALRRRSERAVAAGSPIEQVEVTYRRALTVFGRLGLGRAPSQTPREFAYAGQSRLEAFLAPAEDTPSWDDVTAAFELACYGDREPAQAQLAACASLRQALPLCVRKRVGRLRYILRYFWLV